MNSWTAVRRRNLRCDLLLIVEGFYGDIMRCEKLMKEFTIAIILGSIYFVTLFECGSMVMQHNETIY